MRRDYSAGGSIPDIEVTRIDLGEHVLDTCGSERVGQVPGHLDGHLLVMVAVDDEERDRLLIEVPSVSPRAATILRLEKWPAPERDWPPAEEAARRCYSLGSGMVSRGGGAPSKTTPAWSSGPLDGPEACRMWVSPS